MAAFRHVVLVVVLLTPADALFPRRIGRVQKMLPNMSSGRAAATPTDLEAGVVVASNRKSTGENEASKEDELSRAGLSDWITLWRLSKPDLPLIVVAFCALLIAATGEVLTPQLQSAALNIALQPGGVLQLGPPITQLAVVSILTAVGTGIRGFIFWILGSRLVARLREALYASMLAKPQAFHDGRAPAELGSRLSSDVVRLGDVLSLNINIVLRQVVQTAGGIFFVYRLHPSLAAVLAAGVLARSTWSAFYGGVSRRISASQQDALACTSAVALQGLTMVDTVRAYGTQKFECARYAHEINRLLSMQNRYGAWYGLSRVVTGSLSAVLMCATLARGAALVSCGTLEVGTLTSIVLYTAFVSQASSDIGDQWTSVQVALGSATKVFELVDVSSRSVEETEAQQIAEHQKKSSAVDGVAADAPERSAADAIVVVPASTTPDEFWPRGQLEFAGVSFKYPARDSVTVLDGVTLRVRPGELVAVVGGSGSGKSTLLKLALRFYAPQSGSITLDGRSLESLPESELRHLVTWLPQEPPLLPLTIGENIAYGAGSDVPMERIVSAARAANCHDFIDRLPLGYATPIGVSGSTLSGGQRQRVAIARALLRDPAVLMLDEPTSALDPASAELVEEALRRASARRSVVLITHKPSQAALCDRVVVLENGRVTEEGSPAQLMAQRGRYWEMTQGGADQSGETRQTEADREAETLEK